MPFEKGKAKTGGRNRGAPNKATLEIKEFSRDFLRSERYRENLTRRIMAGKAPYMEVLLHHYGFGKPREKVEVGLPPAPQYSITELARVCTEEELGLIIAAMKRLKAEKAGTITPAEAGVLKVRDLSPRASPVGGNGTATQPTARPA